MVGVLICIVVSSVFSVLSVMCCLGIDSCIMWGFCVVVSFEVNWICVIVLIFCCCYEINVVVMVLFGIDLYCSI